MVCASWYLLERQVDLGRCSHQCRQSIRCWSAVRCHSLRDGSGMQGLVVFDRLHNNAVFWHVTKTVIYSISPPRCAKHQSPPPTRPPQKRRVGVVISSVSASYHRSPVRQNEGFRAQVKNRFNTDLSAPPTPARSARPPAAPRRSAPPRCRRAAGRPGSKR